MKCAQVTAKTAVLAAALCMLAGCALTSKSEPLAIRYFTPESSAGGATRAAGAPAAEPLSLMLGRVRASAYLKERIAYRASAHELGFYETRRWTERPESYLRRALSTSLFEQRGVEPAVAGPSPTLEVELLAFEETRAASPIARLQAVYLLYGSGLPSVERTITVERPIERTQDPTVGVVRALSAALAEGVARISDDVVAQLHAEVARARAASQVTGSTDAACGQPPRAPWNTPSGSEN
jgi:cholesterol transport system auxiliary component